MLSQIISCNGNHIISNSNANLNDLFGDDKEEKDADDTDKDEDKD